MTEPFDWSVVKQAAEHWMELHDTAPKYLLLPWDTTKEVAELAEDIYDIPTERVDVVLPRFDDEIPRPWLNGPIFEPPAPSVTLDKLIARARLLERAAARELTDADIQSLSMEEYASIRHILLPQVQAATRGKSFIEVWKSFIQP